MYNFSSAAWHFLTYSGKQKAAAIGSLMILTISRAMQARVKIALNEREPLGFGPFEKALSQYWLG